jgi:IS30 family transposase
LADIDAAEQGGQAVVRFSEEDKKTIWDMREAGVPVERIAKHVGRKNCSVRKFIADAGGRRPTPRERSEKRLSFAEREEISRELAAGLSLRAIAEKLGRAPSTICREVNANGGRTKYRALQADRSALRRALRPKTAKLTRCRRLRRIVERKLEERWSPQQISAWLALEYPDRPEMYVSHETIYESLFVQGRGALRKELHSCLRTGRAMRRAEAYTKRHVGQGQLSNMVMISERPAEADDRAVPGHWEGDLIFGKKMTAIGTLVERKSRYVMLLKLPNGHGAEAVRKAMTKRIATLPAQLRRSITWDPGQGDGRACPVHGRHRCADLLLRPQEPVAARLEREHQRAATPIPPQDSRPLTSDTARAQHNRPIAQHETSTDPRLDDTISGVRRGCCVDRLRAQALWGHPSRATDPP